MCFHFYRLLIFKYPFKTRDINLSKQILKIRKKCNYTVFHLYNSIIIVFEEITSASTTVYAPKMTWFFCFWGVFLIATNSNISLLHPAMAFIKVGPKSEMPKTFFLSSLKIVTMSLLWFFFVYFFLNIHILYFTC